MVKTERVVFSTQVLEYRNNDLITMTKMMMMMAVERNTVREILITKTLILD